MTKQSTDTEKIETKATKYNWVINKSSIALLPEEKEVLGLGLNFAPTPKRVPVIDILAGVEVATRRARLQVEVSEELRARICSVIKNTKVSQNNMKPSQHQAIASLKRNDTIVIVKADKGNATVVLDKSDYSIWTNVICSFSHQLTKN